MIADSHAATGQHSNLRAWSPVARLVLAGLCLAVMLACEMPDRSVVRRPGPASPPTGAMHELQQAIRSHSVTWIQSLLAAQAVPEGLSRSAASKWREQLAESLIVGLERSLREGMAIMHEHGEFEGRKPGELAGDSVAQQHSRTWWEQSAVWVGLEIRAFPAFEFGQDLRADPLATEAAPLATETAPLATETPPLATEAPPLAAGGDPHAPAQASRVDAPGGGRTDRTHAVVVIHTVWIAEGEHWRLRHARLVNRSAGQRWLWPADQASEWDEAFPDLPVAPQRLAPARAES